MRLYRLKKGIYRVTLSHAGSTEPVMARARELRRFSTVTVPIRPAREMTLQIELAQARPDPGPLPDLAVDSLRRQDAQLRAEVLNFGPAAAGPFTVRLEDAQGRTIAEQTLCDLESAADFVPGTAQVGFRVSNDTAACYRILADPDNDIEEILEENNSAAGLTR